MKIKIVSIIMMLMITVGSFGAVGTSINMQDNEDIEVCSLGNDMNALIVGIADYPPAGPGGPDLQWTDDDAYDMKNVLVSGGWDQNDITLFIDEQGTETAIKSKLNSIASGTTSSSLSLFFFSGHGTQTGSGEALCTYDSYFYDTEVNDILDNFNGRVVCIFDVCHAGGMGPDGGKGNESNFNATLFTQEFLETLGAGNENRVILMACAADEYSYEDPDLENGVFTYFIVEGLEGPADENNDDIITAEETFDYAEPRTVNYKPSQHPQLYDGDPSYDVPVIGGSGSDYVEETCYGIDYSDYSGDVKPHGAHAVLLSDGSADATVWYEFNIWGDEVFEVGIEFCDWGWFGDGPNLYAKNFNTGNFDLLGENMGNQDELVWKWRVTSNPSNYVNSNGKVEIKVYAEKDGFLSGDKTVLDEIGIRYKPKPRVPNLDCSDESLNFDDVKPGETVTGTFTVENVGDSGSYLNWEVDSYPGWGTWTFTPSSGTGLLSGDTKTVNVKVVAPNEQNQQYSGKIKVVNSADPNDYENIDVSLATPQNMPRSHQPMSLLLLQLLERFPLLEQFLLNLR